MASTYSPNLRIELIGNGEQSNIWGNTTNTNLGTLIEQAISGLVSINLTASNATLTVLNGVTDQSRQMIIVATGTPGVTRTITAPAVNKVYIVYNNTNAVLNFVASGGAGVALNVGDKKLLYCDGTNYVEALTYSVAAITSGSINGTTIGATTASTGAFTTLAYTGTFTGSTGVIAIGTNQLHKDATGNIGIGSTSTAGVSLLVQKSLTGSTTATQISAGPTILSGVTSTATIYASTPSTQATSFIIPSLTHYDASFGTKGSGSTITNQYGFRARNTLTTATNNYAFIGDLAAATGRYNLYMSGTASNYIAGTLLIGTTSASGTYKLQVESSDALINTLTIGRGGGGVAFNTTVGNSALTNNTTGTLLTAIGYGALSNNTTGTANTAIGANNLSDNTTGSANTAIGANTMDSLITGSYNTALGNGAFNGSTTGSYNTAVGQRALFVSTTGDNNTAIGTSALDNVTTGSTNIGIGYLASASSATVSNEVTIYNGSVSARFQGAASAWSFVSDARDKTEVEYLPIGLDFITKLQPRKFQWDIRNCNVDKGKEASGFIAQEVLEVINMYNVGYTGLVDTNNSDQYTLATGNLIPILVNAIKELTTRLEILEGK